MDAVNSVTISAIVLLTTLIIGLLIAPPAQVNIHHNDESTTEQVVPDLMMRSLEAKLDELSDISARLKRISDSQSEMEESLSRLIDDVGSGSGEKMLTERKVNNIQTWISAAAMPMKRDEVDTCSESETRRFDGVMSEMQKSKEITSDCLSIIANIKTHLQKKLGHTMH